MDKTDVRRLLAQHDIQLTDVELESVLFRLSQRAQGTIYSGNNTAPSRPTDTITRSFASSRRPRTSTHERPRVPLLKTAGMIPRTAPSQLAPSPINTSRRLRGRISDFPLAATQQIVAEDRAILEAPNIENMESTNHQRNCSTLQSQEQEVPATNPHNSSISKIARIAVNDRAEYFHLRKTGDTGTLQRAPWQSQKKQYRKNPNAIVVGGLDAVFRMTNQKVVNIDNIRSGKSNEFNKMLPPDIVVDPTTRRTIALAHQRRVLYEDSQVTPVATRESAPIETPRIIEMDARVANPLSGRKSFRDKDKARHASGGWATNLDYRDLHHAPWTTTAQDPLLSYRSPVSHRIGKRELHPSWNGPTNGRVVVPVGINSKSIPPSLARPDRMNRSAVNSPRLAYQRRVNAMDEAVKGWDECQTRVGATTQSVRTKKKDMSF